MQAMHATGLRISTRKLTPIRTQYQGMSVMPKYVIERDLPGAGKLSAAELKAIAQKSCGVLNKMGPRIQWLQSYVTGDKIYCVYIAPNEKAVRDHAQQGGFPANRVSEVTRVIDPATAEGRPATAA